MCDYSLTGITNRLAIEGEDLLVHRFPTGSLGLASPVQRKPRWWFGREVPAVCVPPGARLALVDVPPVLRRYLGIGHTEIVTFVQLGAQAYQYRDAVRFANGRELRLQELPVGLRLRVLSLASAGESHVDSSNSEQGEESLRAA
jgi:hypothetical protein